MLDNVSGIVISAADLRSAPECVRDWVMGREPACDQCNDGEPDYKVVEPKAEPEPAEEFSMSSFVEEAKAFMAKNGPPAMLELLREVGAERVSQCSEDQANGITVRMRSYEQSR